jgi:hypothetical protein
VAGVQFDHPESSFLSLVKDIRNFLLLMPTATDHVACSCTLPGSAGFSERMFVVKP